MQPVFQKCQTFEEFEAYTQSVRNVEVDFTLPRLTKRLWQIRHTFLDGLHLQYAYEGGGNIAEGGVEKSGYLLFVPLSEIEVRANGGVMSRGDVFIGAPNADFRLSCDLAHEWFTLFIPTELLVTGPELIIPGMPGNASSRMLHPGEQRVNELRRLVGSLNLSSETDGSVMDREAARRELRAELVSTVRTMLGTPPPVSPITAGRPAVERDGIIRSAKSFLEEAAGAVPSVDQLALAADVSERTLRTVFGEFYGLSPAKYIRLLRLNETRRALERTGPGGASVTEIASFHGFWDFGRFAKEYRQAFGELPSQTLKRKGGTPPKTTYVF